VADLRTKTLNMHVRADEKLTAFVELEAAIPNRFFSF
jgi:hypothetical protein